VGVLELTGHATGLVVLVASRALVGSLLVAAGIAKLFETPDRRLQVVRGYEILPPGLARVASSSLPAIELFLGGSLLAGVLMPIPAVGALLLFGGFAVAMAINLFRGRSIECGCFGSQQETRISWGAVVRNLSLAALSLLSSGPGAQGWRWPIDYVPSSSVDLLSRDAMAASVTGIGVLLLGLLAVVLRRTRRFPNPLHPDSEEWMRDAQARRSR
jgi:Methylamine utilisation protein MauE